jgi:hypothetical protein
MVTYVFFFWYKEVNGRHAEFMILYVNMWFLSCRVAVPKIFKYGCIINHDFYAYIIVD